MLASLQDSYPYSQVVHNLAARAAQDNDLATREHLLHVSAIYTTDRSVLKSIMTATPSGRIAVEKKTEKHSAAASAVKPVEEIALVSEPIIVHKRQTSTEIAKEKFSEAIVVPVVEKESTGSKTSALTPSELTGDALVKDIMAELKKLKIAKQKFEVSVEDYEKHVHDEPVKKSSKKIADPSDTLIEEIKTTKKKVAPEGKQKDQIEIIENFIKTKPSIAKNKNAAVPASDDLAEKSLVYGDNIVSETLVEILLKQGKKEKAIEVLKKLIWKFPQKKAYFAARIEELKS